MYLFCSSKALIFFKYIFFSYMNDALKHILDEFHLPLHNPVLIFSLILFIILLAPILLKRLNVPGIIGLIISGVVIGPHGLNILEKTSAVELFSTIGLLYIMFIAGLELDMNEFRLNRNKSLLFGFFTFIIPIGLGFPVCYYFLGLDLNASLLTASMFATHTLVAYPIVSKMGISKNPAVAISVGGTILTDTAVLIILAVIIGNSHGSLNRDFWIRLSVSLALFAAIMFLVIPRIAKWFFRKLESEKHAHYIFVLSVVFFSAFLAQLSGVEPIIGAFVAGLALNRLIPHSSALMNRIEFIGNALFIPFFLISVGMVVDVSVILNGPHALIVAFTLTIAALLGKWLAAFFTQVAFRFTKAQRQLIFGLSSAHAAATLAVILVGFNVGILDENVLNGTIILILVTCIVATLVTEKAAKKIVLSDENGESITEAQHSLANEHLLVSVTEASPIEKLLEFALLIKDRKSANPISMLSVVPNNEEAETNILRSKNKQEEYVRQASAAEIKVNHIVTIDHHLASGIARTSREILADLVLMGLPERAGFLDKLIGEQTESILSSVHKCLFFVQLHDPLITHKRIMAFAPPLAERENGFEIWLEKLCRLSHELSVPILFYGDSKTHDGIQKQLKNIGAAQTILFNPFTTWEDFLILGRDIQANDLLWFVLSRNGSVSHMSALDNIPWKLEKYFSRNSKVIAYPQQYRHNTLTDTYDKVPSGPLTKGIETIGKGIENIFKRSKEE